MRTRLPVLFAFALACPAVGGASGVGLYQVIQDCPNVPDTAAACLSVPISGVTAPGETMVELLEGAAVLSHSASLNNSATGGSSSTYGLAALTGWNGLPALGVLANSADRYSVAYSKASSSRDYDYVGASPVVVPLQGTLTFEADITSADTSWPRVTFASARVFMTDANYVFVWGVAPNCGVPGVLASGFASAVAFPSGPAGGAGQFNIAVTTDCAGNPLMVVPGQHLQITAEIEAYGWRGGAVDGSHTFTLDLASSVSDGDRANLLSTLLPRPVPEPSLAFLLLVGSAVSLVLPRR